MVAILPTGLIGHILDAIASLQHLKPKRVALVAEGFSNPEVAEQLDVPRLTVQNHRASIREKLNITSNADCVKLALAFDLIRL